MALEPYRPNFIGLTLLFLGLAFRRLYHRLASLRTQHALRRFAHGDAPASNLQDGRIAAAQPLGCAVARAAVLLKGDIPNAPTAAFRCARLAPARGAGRHPTNR
jgi:hypothetical protein